MTPTEQFIYALQSLKPGDLGRLRKHAGLPLDESLDGFDLFTGLWWPLREKSSKAPRREVAWLVAKLYAFCPMQQSSGATLAAQFGKFKDTDKVAATRRQRRFDDLLMCPLSQIEPALRWAITLIAEHEQQLDWVCLTDELSIWERDKTRLKWAKQYLQLP